MPILPGFFFDPPQLSIRSIRVLDPDLDALDELAGFLSRIFFADHRIALSEQLAESAHRASTSIDANDGMFALPQDQIERLLCLLDQAGKRLEQVEVAGIELIDNDLAILACQDPSLLSPSAVTRLRKIAFDALLGLLTTRDASEIHIENEPAIATTMRGGPTVALHERGVHSLHLLHVFCSCSVKRLLSNGLFTSLALVRCCVVKPD